MFEKEKIQRFVGLCNLIAAPLAFQIGQLRYLK